MRTYGPWLRALALAVGIAAIVVLVGAITHTYNVVAAGIVTFAVVLVIIAGIEGARRYWRTQGTGVAVEVQRADGKRETITLDPRDDESMTRFSRTLEDDFARRTPPASLSPPEQLPVSEHKDANPL